MFAFRIISRQDVNFGFLLKSVMELTGKKVSEYADNAATRMNNTQKLASCMSAMVDLPASEFSPIVNEHLSFTGLVYIEKELFNDYMTTLCGLKWLGAPTTNGEGYLGLVTGNLNQWKASIKAGLSQQSTLTEYSEILRRFKEEGYGDVWKDQKFTEVGNVFLIEDKSK